MKKIGIDKPKKGITTQAAKAKGRQMQYWACEQISDLLGMPWGKDEYIASREASQTGTDVRLVGPAQEQFPYSVECKFQESWSVHNWIDQAKCNTAEGTNWLLLAKRSYKDPVAIVDAKHFFELQARIRELEGNVKGGKD